MHVIIYMYSLLTGQMEAADIHAVNIQTDRLSFNTINHPFEKEENTDLLYMPIHVHVQPYILAYYIIIIGSIISLILCYY